MVQPQAAAMETAAMETAIPVTTFSEAADEEPDDNDVVLGRGKRYQYHPGNLFFQSSFYRGFARAPKMLSLTLSDSTGNHTQTWCFIIGRDTLPPLTQSGDESFWRKLLTLL
jgi:hypothetical protein